MNSCSCDLFFVSDASQVEVTNFIPVMETAMRPYVNMVMKTHTQNRKRVGVLISGTGTNLQVFFHWLQPGLLELELSELILLQ
jgi:hypothetical protein